MAAIFSKTSDLILKVAGAVIGLGAVSGIAAFAYFSYPTVIDTGYQPKQPVAYSHKLHAGELGLSCYYCHYTVNKAAFAAVPGTEVCMGCHWHHLIQSFKLGDGRYRKPPRRVRTLEDEDFIQR